MKIINSRRSFIKNMGAGLLGGAAFGSGILPAFANAATNSSSQYKALICLNLNGGNDAFNTIVPMADSVYANYNKIRQELALPKEKLNALVHANTASAPYGLHPVLGDVSKLYNKGKLAVVANLGNLIEPVEKASYKQAGTRLPSSLFAHNDQAIFSHALNNGPLDSGWAGRIAEALGDFNINQQLAMNITLSGSNQLQRGHEIMPFGLTKAGINKMSALSEDNPGDLSAKRAQLYRHFLGRNHANPLQQYFSDTGTQAWTMSKYVADILDRQPKINTPLMSSRGLSESFATVARIIAANQDFQVKRQIFYINFGPFDTHGYQLIGQANLLTELNSALSEFYETLTALGYEDKVTTFTLSEFGRTLSRNGTDGTDHGWGSHHFVMGGAVKGQQIFGKMPSLELGSDDDIGEGRIIPTLSFDQYAATLAQWFGVSSDDVDKIFPNLKNFSTKNIGFLT
ncbi:Tat pathway signal protein [Cellvibrio zantedeschiae]|uniref:Tat pathway signal protein n=1 Tax=Cellvibrio zantedeschiae TaxID=1237077 RepID=A0ABQ3ASE5_9GAMM|nr:DUF1501 domain-containing protein [Cellvibrio zantedeschiae]GGY65802.1 Tat pathway signal protein [Cellvibrio zantedeschiae]